MTESEGQTQPAAWKPKDVYRLAEHHYAPSTTVRDFETAFASKVGAKHAILVNSHGAALQLAWFVPFELKNRRVVIPACASPLVVAPAILSGFEPVLCEIEATTWGIDSKNLRRLCEGEKGPPSVVVVTHLLGVPANLTEIAKLKEEFGFLVIEDAHEALGSILDPVGNALMGAIGEIVVFPAAGGAAAICTENPDLCSVMLLARGRGLADDCPPGAQERLAAAEPRVTDPFLETYHLPGLDARPSSVQGQASLGMLSRLDLVTEARRKNHAAYFTRFSSAKTFSVQSAADKNANIASSGFGVLASSNAHRAKVVEALEAKGIETSPIGAGYIGRQPFWITGYPQFYTDKGEPKRARPLADRIHNCGFVLPTHPGISVEEVGYIADIVLAVTA